MSKPFDIAHIEKDLSELKSMLLRFDEEVRVVMEATDIYHLPVLTYLQEKEIFVAVINPYLMKVYRSGDLRKAKTDKIDSRIIANYGIEHWFTMTEFQTSEDIYGELKLLCQQYRHYMKKQTDEQSCTYRAGKWSKSTSFLIVCIKIYINVHIEWAEKAYV